MALLDKLRIEANERKSVKLKNHRTGQNNLVTYAVLNNATMNFDGGEIAVQLSFDGGLSWNTTISGGETITFTTEHSDNVICNSDEQEPVLLGFEMTGAGAPSVDIHIYDNT